MNPSTKSLSTKSLQLAISMCESQHLKPVADAFNMTQSAVSKSLQRTAEILEKNLFVRTSTGLKPTAEMKELYPKLKEALASLNTALEIEDFKPLEYTKPIRIAIPDILIPIVGQEIISKMNEIFPHAPIRLSTWSKGTISSILSNELDIGINEMCHKAPSSIQQTHVLSDKVSLYAHESQMPFRKEDIHLWTLINPIIDQENATLQKMFNMTCEKFVESNRNIHVDNAYLQNSLLATGKYVMLRPHLGSSDSLTKVHLLKVVDRDYDLASYSLQTNRTSKLQILLNRVIKETIIEKARS